VSFHDPRKYPLRPGSKGGDTSDAAAESIAAIASPLRFLALRTLSRLGAATALEVVAQSGRERWTIAPRLSELHALGMIEDIGARRQNPSGANARVWQLTATGHKALAAKGVQRA